jgi:hypothetical protein
MSVTARGRDSGGGTVGVDIELDRSLAARAGTRGERVLVPAGSTVAEAIEAWADGRGEHVRFALLEGTRLRSNVRAARCSDGTTERLSGSSRVLDGDVVRFERRE